MVGVVGARCIGTHRFSARRLACGSFLQLPVGTMGILVGLVVWADVLGWDGKWWVGDGLA